MTSDLNIPDKDAFLKAIAASRHSSAGLDGIPYGAYAHSSEIAEIFSDVAAFMATPASIPPYDFNHSILCVLPKNHLSTPINWRCLQIQSHQTPQHR